MSEVRELTPQECRAFLGSGVAGRAALSTPNGPHIVPVNYSMVEDAIVIRTSPYSLLGTYGRDTMLAFEIDEFDATHHRGWSVVARGRVETVSDARELTLLKQGADPHPWAGGVRALYLRLRPTELTGRAVGTTRSPLSTLPTGT